ncbi:MAG TPA: HAD-IIIC family phosphatase, partial [Polyangia bacterium]
MSVQYSQAVPLLSARRPSVVLSATFTVDPLVDPLAVLLGETGLELDVTVAPYAQVFQELLDPGRLFAANRDGVNVVLVRFGDWLRNSAAGPEPASGRILLERNVRDLVAAVRQAAAATPATFVVCVCPSAPGDVAEREDRVFYTALETRLAQGMIGVPNARLLTEDQTGAFDANSVHDAERDRLAHVPYRPVFFASLGRALARLLHALRMPPHKVLVLDCDNTLWKGVVGEDGVHGIEITEAHRHLQTFVVAKKHAGMIICLASKNSEGDVLAVFRERSEMVLQLGDIVATRINWLPKSQNLHALAGELKLGLDSFVFVDDNPVECAEVTATCPGVLVLNLPLDQDPTAFLRNVWPLDQIDFTDEDGRRTELYRQNLERDRYQRAAPSIGDFVAGLDLSITIAPPRDEQMARVAQLTQRTNQFNFTTLRRTEADLRRLSTGGLVCRAVEVRDRFGDYGLVGVMIVGHDVDALAVDTFLLSCRVLGRGVEHAMVRAVGQMAREREVER